MQASAELTNIQRPLRERIGRLPVRANTIQNELFGFLRLRHTDTPRTWASEIACDLRYQRLALENWELDDGDEQSLRLILEPLDLPKQTPDKVSGAAQMAVLDLGGRQGLKVSLRSLPKPAEVPGWKTLSDPDPLCRGTGRGGCVGEQQLSEAYRKEPEIQPYYLDQ